MKFKAYLEKIKGTVDAKLGEYLPRPSGRGVRPVYEAMRYSLFTPGKRIRPIITVESAKLCGAPLKAAIAAACAVEMVHTYSLIHDDLPSMDDSSYRRGKPSCHIAFGQANAILAGDALLTLAFNILSAEMRHAQGLRAVRELSEAAGIAGMVGGQAMDIGSKAKEPGPAAMYAINRLKTARLFEAAAKLGAIAAGADKRKIDALGRYGAGVGMAFQITDDIIDDEAYAKAAGNDRARRAAASAAQKARASLGIFSHSANRLVEIADYILRRVE